MRLSHSIGSSPSTSVILFILCHHLKRNFLSNPEEGSQRTCCTNDFKPKPTDPINRPSYSSFIDKRNDIRVS
ncbi:Uncharacterized protein APZ42_023727 [Daphnia magna]|uniref:Uncharacterized protein n=1 Tax=Daphnia magna TaxID=35525 RepID=A0A164UQ35_9CRUS|nr:Uncharacterized protein APZ42_023727 [Daphnia magna]